MVEYAMLTAGPAVRMMYGQVTSVASSVNWVFVGGVVLVLLTLRLLFTPKV